MNILNKNNILFYLILSIVLFLSIPFNAAKATNYGCIVNGECQNIDSNVVGARAQCLVRAGEFQNDPCAIHGCVVSNICSDITGRNFFDANSKCSVKGGKIFVNLCGNLKKYGCTVNRECNNIFVEDYANSGCEGELLRSLCPTFSGDCEASGACSVYRCTVINDPENKLKPGQCREFKSANDADAIAQARNVCAKTLDEANKVEIFKGACAGSEQDETVNRGSSANELLTLASKTLNRASISDPFEALKRIINLLTAFIGSITLVLYVVAGLMWMTAQGNGEQTDRAKKILVWTTLGVFVILFSYILVNFLFSAIPK